MSRLIPITFVIFTICLTVSACGPSQQTVTLTASDNGKSIELNQDDILEIRLEGNPTTGFMWEIETLETTILKLVGETEFDPDSEATGSGGTVKLSFEAIDTGKTDLKLVYHQPWDTETPPTEVFIMSITVK